MVGQREDRAGDERGRRPMTAYQHWGRNALDEIEGLTDWELVDDRGDDPVEPRAHALRVVWRERFVHGRPNPRVIRWVRPQQPGREDPLQRFELAVLDR